MASERPASAPGGANKTTNGGCGVSVGGRVGVGVEAGMAVPVTMAGVAVPGKAAVQAVKNRHNRLTKKVKVRWRG
jgi:hypothetical protein